VTSGELWAQPLQFAAFLGVVFFVMLVRWVLMPGDAAPHEGVRLTGANVMSRLSGVTWPRSPFNSSSKAFAAAFCPDSYCGFFA